MDTGSRLVVAVERGWFEGGMEWEVGVNKCKLLYIEWINNNSYYIAQNTIFGIP